MAFRRQWPWLVGILLLAALTRWLHIDAQSLWVDEGYAVYHANYPSLTATLARDTHPPLYFAALRLWQALTGWSELALRTFSVLPSLLSLAVIVPLTRELLRLGGLQASASPVPVLAALMLALADAENYLAQEARHYTWLVLLVLCSMWFFLRWQRTQSRRDLSLWTLFTTLMVYTHYITAFMGVVQGLYALAFLRGRVRVTAIASLVTSALLLAPWLLTVGVQQLDNDGANWSQPLSLGLLLDIRQKWFTQQWPLTLGLAVLGAGSLLARRWRGLAPASLLLLWLSVPFALTVLVNEFLPFLQPRRLTAMTPAIALLIAFGLGWLRMPARSFLVAVLLVYGVTTVDWYRHKAPWREVAALTADYAQSGHLALSDVAGGDYQLQYYYRRMLNAGVTYRSLKEWRDFHPATYLTGAPALIDDHDTVWLMHWSDDPWAFTWLDEGGYQRTAHFSVDHLGHALNVYRYDRALPDAIATYGNGMQLLEARRVDQGVALLWRTDDDLADDLTVSVKLLDASGALIAQHDGSPQGGRRPTSTWQPSQAVFDPHPISAPPGRYRLVVEVYQWTPEGITTIPTSGGEAWADLGVLAWP